MKLFCSIIFSLLLTFLLSHERLCAQNQKTDSLLKVAFNSPNDSARVRAFNTLGQAFTYQNPDTAIYFAQNALLQARQMNFSFGEGNAEHLLGSLYYLKTEHEKAFKHFFNALNVWDKIEKTGDPEWRKKALNAKSGTLLNLGLIYDEQANYLKALDCYMKSLKTFEKYGNKRGIATALANIGAVYKAQDNSKKASDYYLKALKAYEGSGDGDGAALVLGNLGTIEMDNGNSQEALNYFSKALDAYKNLNNTYGTAIELGNIGVLYGGQSAKATDKTLRDTLALKALYYYKISLKLREEIDNKELAAATLINMGVLYRQMGNNNPDKKNEFFKNSEACFKKALELSRETENLEDLKELYNEMSSLCVMQGLYKEGFGYYKTYVLLKDSISNQSNVKKQTQLEMQFEFDKKQTADSVKVAEEKKLAQAELRMEKNKSYSLYGGLALLLIFAVFMYNRFRVTQKQKIVIEEQKVEVEDQKRLVDEKQKELLDSIGYAKRIQMALMPNDKGVQALLKKTKGP